MSIMSNVYRHPTYEGRERLRHAMDNDRVVELRTMIIAAGLEEADLHLAENACLRLSTHADDVLRGNAILCFGHLARRFGELTPEAVERVVRGLTDPSDYVRGQAHAAASDVKHFLGIDLRACINRS
jgi:hypothetical protein